MRDLVDPRLLWLKAALFVVIGVAAAAILLMRNPNVQTVVLLALAIWAFCRLYYFCFYVIERYVDPTFRFSGLGAVVWYLVTRR